MRDKHDTYQMAKRWAIDAAGKKGYSIFITYDRGFRIRNYIKALASHIKADLDNQLRGGIK